MKPFSILAYILILSGSLSAQKATYDIIAYNAPDGWTSQPSDGFTSYSRVDGSSWSQITIYRHSASTGDIQTDFDRDWKELAVGSRTITAPEKTEPTTANGWTTISGSGMWQYNGANVACILTVYSNSKVSLAVLCNATAQPYLKDYNTLLASIQLDAVNMPEAPGTPSIVGLWTNYRSETSGYVNGMPMMTAGYFRTEYFFYPDGTYLFRTKNWSVYIKDILFVYETGAWAIAGNQLTITPKKGRGQWWSKAASGRTAGWGSLQKSSTWKSEPVTYTFEFKYYSGTKETNLILRAGQSTERDGSASSNGQGEWYYSPRATDKSLIDDPPGVNTGSSPLAASSLLTGRIWDMEGNHVNALIREGSVNKSYYFETSPEKSAVLPGTTAL